MSYRSPVMAQLSGACAADGVDAGVAAHYGALSQEQRLLLAGQAFVDQSQRGVVVVEGSDRLPWLSALSSQDLSALACHESRETLFLTLQGKIEYDAHVLDDGERTWLLVERAEATPLSEWLSSMKFLRKVQVQNVSHEWGIVAGTCPLPQGQSFLAWCDPWPHVATGGFAYSSEQHPGLNRPWYETLVRLAPARQSSLPTVVAPELAGLVQALTWAGSWAAEALRVAAWRPRWGQDCDTATLPHEVDLLRTAVHLNKGCYKGQESVARVHNLGHPPRRLTFFLIDGSNHTLPRAGAQVLVAELPAGHVTSIAWHYEMGPVALGFMKRKADPAAQVLIRDDSGAYAATQEVVVAPDAGHVVQRPTGLLRRH